MVPAILLVVMTGAVLFIRGRIQVSHPDLAWKWRARVNAARGLHAERTPLWEEEMNRRGGNFLQCSGWRSPFWDRW